MGTEAAKVEAELEVWRNAARGLAVIKKFGVMGQIIEEQVQGGKTVHLTPKERRLNQEKAADDSLDVFKNGMLVPVHLIDSEEDTEELQANTNAMSESAMKALFRSQMPTFKAKIAEISNPTSLQRLVEVCGEVDGSVRQLETIQARLAEVSPQVTEVLGAQSIGGAGIGTQAPRGLEGPEGARKRPGVTPK
jgi:hypothetical protein